ncbi:protein of unknown function [Muriicola jejuensis]|uniref:DUF1080 domain-containing protein n=1 Tax=Muriicola jejuensis TaxID=504488 RepID=A0A6P0UES3_9FLAO|nr:DUF1080 domain-containing protein [Muriicola jejuensis]NER09763.1 DUF1080 domain-containing protein [Muriicola jejuensis]SMP05936.1 protein of unknown function [Muriicola jejuensis]
MKTFQILLVSASLILAQCREKSETEIKATQEMAVSEHSVNDKEGWEILFDGTSFDQWKGYRQEGMAEHWKIEEGAMVFSPPAERKGGESFNIVSRQDYGNFILSLEWKVAEGANSGIFWGVKEDPAYGQPYETGPEIQVLDNTRHPDAKNGITHQAGALYDMVAPSEDVTRPAGEWNTCVITVNYAEHTGKVNLNGVDVVTFPLDNPEWDAMVSNSKFADWPGFGKHHMGKIGLQDHGDVVAFRNIRIKRL